MDTVTAADKTYPLDKRGFLADPGVWDLDFASAMASRLGMSVELTLLHLKVVLFVRHYFIQRGRVPRIFETCRGCGLSLATLRRLFPCGYQRAVCRLSGISYDTIDHSHHALTFETRFRQSERQGGDEPGRPSSRPSHRPRG